MPPKNAKQKGQGGKPELLHYTGHVQVLATDIDHNGPSVLVFVDQKDGGRYLFNASEGLQRMFREYKLKIQKVDHFIFTRISTETCAGFPGMVLSVNPTSDAGGLMDKKALCSAHGPPGLAQYVDTFRGYINQDQTVNVTEYGAKGSPSEALPPVVKNSVVTIQPVLIHPAACAAAEGAATGAAEGAEDAPTAKRQKTDAGAQQAGGPAPAKRKQDAVLAYVCEFGGRPGKFDPIKAAALGVPPGELYGQLQRGSAVPNKDGVMVQPEQVMDPPYVAGPLLLVLDCPSLEHLEGLRQQQALGKWMSASHPPGQLCLLAHLGPPSVVQSEAYQAWMRSACGAHWRHIIARSGPAQPVSLRRATQLQVKLNMLDPALYPSLALPPASEAMAAAKALLPALTPEVPYGSSTKTTTTTPATAKPGKAAPATATDGDATAAAPTSDAINPLADADAAAATADATATPVPDPPYVFLAPNLLKYVLMPPKSQGIDMGDVPAELDVAELQEAFRPQLQELLNPSEPSTAPAQEPAEAAMQVDAPAATHASSEQRGQQAGASSSSSSSASTDVPEAIRNLGRDECEITWLGTASSQPSKYRNVSATLVDMPGRRACMLVDCGEDTMGQLKRRFGHAVAERKVLEELQCVWVSHMHADHHGGLYRLLEWRAAQGGAPLMVIGPMPLFRVLNNYSRILPLSYHFIPNLNLFAPGSVPDNVPAPRPLPPAMAAAFEAIKSALGLAELRPFPVAHVAHSAGLMLAGQAGWKVVFSGDTRPCQQVIDAARGASLLVHEATFELDMAKEAMAKRHSTTGEALEVAAKSGVYSVVLTHFSTRYPTMPTMDLGVSHPLGVATDFMTLNLADLPHMAQVTARLSRFFKQEEEGFQEEDKADGAN